jgi:phospholipid/cholesterol/gamma-HCH transport system permease protein
VNTLRTIGRFSIFSGQVLKRAVLFQWQGRAFIAHLDTTVRRCSLPVLAVVFPFGMVISLQGLEVFKLFGAERMIASLASVAIVRELAPVLASILVAAQGGSANAAELGAMRIEEELDATEVMAVDGLSYHVTPRVLALMFACPILNILGTIGGLAGAFVTAVYVKGENAGIFMSELGAYTTTFDLYAAFIKTTIFGLIIGLVSCFLGYTVTGGAAGVGRAVNNTVVYSVLLFITANYFLTSALFGMAG